LGQASGGFAPATAYRAGTARDLAVADLNNDGRPDLVTANALDGVGVLLGQAGGGFTPTTAYPTSAGETNSVAVADANQDGYLDIVATVSNNANANVTVLWGTGGGSFPTTSTYLLYTPVRGVIVAPNSVAVADLNGDGRPDIVVGDRSGSPPRIGVLLGQGNGRFAVIVDIATAVGCTNCESYTLTVADVNSDGRPDIVTGGIFRSFVEVWLNKTVFTPLATSSNSTVELAKVFPNPAHDHATVTLPGLVGISQAQIELQNALGQVVWHQTTALPSTGLQLTLPTARLATGFYVVRLQAGEVV